MEASSRKYKGEKGEWIEAQNRNNPLIWDGLVNEEASETMPNQSMSIQEILQKHVRGINVAVSHEGIYEDATIDSPQISKLIDVTEVKEMQDEVVAKLNANIRAKKSASATEVASAKKRRGIIRGHEVKSTDTYLIYLCGLTRSCQSKS